MTEKQFLKRGFKLNEHFELNGKTFCISRTYGRHYTVYCYTDQKCLVTRGNLDTCVNKVINYK